MDLAGFEPYRLADEERNFGIESIVQDSRIMFQSTFLSIASSEPQLELTGSLMTSFLYSLSCTRTQFISYMHISVQYELWFHSTNAVLDNTVGIRSVMFRYEDDLQA